MSDRPHDSDGTTVADAARILGISEGAVRKRVERGKLYAERRPDGRLLVYLDATTTDTTRDTTHDRPRPSRGDRYTRSLEDQVEYLRRQLERRDEELREHRRLLAGLIERVPELEAATPQEPSEAVETVEEEPERAEPHPGTEGANKETTRPSASASRLGMSPRALAVGAIATLLTWYATWGTNMDRPHIISLALPVLVPLLSGLWAGSTKRPSFLWFSSPHRWLRPGGRSVLETALLVAGIPAGVGVVASLFSFALDLRLTVWDVAFLLPLFTFALMAFALAALAFMSGAFLGNALRRVGLLGTRKELPQGEEEGDGEEEVWSAKKEARWGLAGTLIAALISAAASVVAAALS